MSNTVNRSNRLVSLGGPHVDDATSNREFGAVFDEVLAPVTQGTESFNELVAVEVAASANHEWRRDRLGREDLRK
jgi:hypothetical protein